MSNERAGRHLLVWYQYFEVEASQGVLLRLGICCFSFPHPTLAGHSKWRPRFCTRYQHFAIADYVDPADLPSFAGALYCTNAAGCGLFPVTVSTNFSGVYGTGNALAATVSEASLGSSALPSSRRRLRLMPTVPFREEGGGVESLSNVAGSNKDNGENNDERVDRVRKHDARDFLTSEQDMVNMFLRHR